MAKGTKVSSFINRQGKKLKSDIQTHGDTLEKSTKATKAKRAEMLKKYAKFIKVNEVRKHYMKLVEPNLTLKFVNAINDTIGDDHKSENEEITQGERWEKEYVETLTDLMRLVSDALSCYNKKLQSVSKKKDKIDVLLQKIEDFQNSTLSQMKEMINDTKKPATTHSPATDYLYDRTPFQ